MSVSIQSSKPAANPQQAPRRIGGTRYRTGATDTDIRSAVGACSLGSLLVAASTRGICALFLGDDPETLIREFRGRFPNARMAEDDADFERIVAQVATFIEAPNLEFKLPLDMQGTAFQRQVWQALREIPAGARASYAEIARRIGSPRAVRAVAGACAANPLAVVIPCHRAVRTDGTLSGYRWDVKRKAELLRRESGA
jgi:AraC family transcriptional regulator of adaptative response/methylated-DNA-[protein]-cysteine methyltransferase